MVATSRTQTRLQHYANRAAGGISTFMLTTLASLCCGPAVSQAAPPATSVASHHPAAELDRLRPDNSNKSFVRRQGANLYRNGRLFRFAGSNNYYPIYKSPLMVDALFDKAAANGFDVMRVWGSLDIGNQDGSNSVDGTGSKEGVYFQYWDGTAPAYNDGPDGLQRLDYVVYKAGQNGVRLVIPFVNNWNAFGGMDQYVRWRGGQFHDDFYTDPLILQWYKDWIAHVLNRVNVYTGVKYKDDPTIMTWELANEPRCLSAGVYPRSSSCTTDTVTGWADEVSAFIKSIDRNHLVSVGDEGFYCTPGAEDWTENCSEGVDTVALAKLKHIDVMSVHLYPDSWGKDAAFGTQWIRRHVLDARRLGKAVMLGEFGLRDRNVRNPIYRTWTDTLFQAGGNGALYWILSDIQDDGTLYPDYDQFTVYCPSPVCTTMRNFAQTMRTGFPWPYRPVADDDRFETALDVIASFAPLANDRGYAPFRIAPGSIDLDVTAPGQQTAITIAHGSFQLQADSTVSFTPTPGFSGTASLPYRVKDTAGRPSNVASLIATVRPPPTAALQLFSFESGTDGWHSINTLPATLSQSGEYATHGTASLRVDVGDSADWFGVNLTTPTDLSAKTHLRLDLTLVGAAQGHNVALQVGDDFAWCEGTWQNADADTSIVLDIDLTAMGCRAAHNNVRAVWLFLGGTRTYYIDNVRAE